MKRIENFAERKKTKSQTGKIGPHYVCGCGGDTYILCKNGDCVCSMCLRAQARIIVNEVQANDHRNYYTTVAQVIAEHEAADILPEIAPEVRQRMIDTDTVITITFYPTTPVGSYEIWHHDLDAALDEALGCLRAEGLLS